MLPRSVKRKVTLGSEDHVTVSAGVSEQVGEMLRLHMVPGTGAVLVRKVFAKSAVELSIKMVLPHELEQLFRVLKCATCMKK